MPAESFRERMLMWIYGWIIVAEGVINIVTLGHVVPHWSAKFLFSDWVSDQIEKGRQNGKRR